MDTAFDTAVRLPVYETLADRLRRAIRQGDYRPGDLLGTEHGLAREKSISRMTVRRASEMLISEGLIERRPGKGLYVRAHQVHQTGDTSAVQQIQVVAGNLQWEPSVQISRGVQTYAKGQGLQVQLYDAHGSEGLDLEIIRQLPRSGAKGAVIISLHSPSFIEAIYALKQRRFPFVLVDQRLHDIEVPSVLSDSHAGGYAAGRMLLEAGHRRIGFIGDLIAMTVRDRLAGLRDAVNDDGLPFDRSLIVDLVGERMGDWSTLIDEGARQLLSRPDRPTAVFCSCDGVARLLYRTVAAMGLRVPDDLSIIGFDDDPLCEWLTPPLSTVRQPFNEMGQAAIELLCKRIADPAAPVEHRVLPVQLIRRASVAARSPAAG